VYVGSTKETLKIRLGRHRGYYNEYEKGEAPQCSSFEIMKCPTAYITLLEECDVSVRYERERHWIQSTPNCVNVIHRPRRTEEERKEYHKEWVEQNQDTLHDYRRQYYVQNKDEIQAQHKEYNDSHKEQTKQRCKEYYERNKERILAQNKIYKDKIRGKVTT
jgi:gas vesicle protein